MGHIQALWRYPVKSMLGERLESLWPQLEGTFHDVCAIHAIISATLAALRRLEPSLDFAVERFRPNLLIESAPGLGGFVEERWAGDILAIGERLILRAMQRA